MTGNAGAREVPSANMAQKFKTKCQAFTKDTACFFMKASVATKRKSIQWRFEWHISASSSNAGKA
jgi:hypothetical protein